MAWVEIYGLRPSTTHKQDANWHEPEYIAIVPNGDFFGAIEQKEKAGAPEKCGEKDDITASVQRSGIFRR